MNLRLLYILTLSLLMSLFTTVIGCEEAQRKANQDLSTVFDQEGLDELDELRQTDLLLAQAWLESAELSISEPIYPDLESINADLEFDWVALDVSWTAFAQDDRLEGYRVLVNELEYAQSTDHELRLNELIADQWYNITVELSLKSEQNQRFFVQKRVFIPAQSRSWAWPNEARLNVEQAGTGTLLSWPNLIGMPDLTRLTYRLVIKEETEEEILLISAQMGSYSMIHLPPLIEGQEYLFELSIEPNTLEPNTPEQESMLTALESLSIDVQGRDRSAPFWPSDIAELSYELNDLEQTLILAWPLAQDLVGVTHYQLLLNQQVISQFQINELAENQEDIRYTLSNANLEWGTLIEVIAYDEAGYASPPLSTVLNPTPQAIPTWPPQAQLRLTELNAQQAKIAWPHLLLASDPIPADQFTVRIHSINTESEIRNLQVNGEQNELLIDELLANTQYEIRLIPHLALDRLDVLDNASLLPSLSLNIHTPPYPSPQWQESQGQESTIHITDLTHEQLSVEWLPATARGYVEYYEILLNEQVYARLSLSDLSSDPRFRLNEANGRLQFTLSDLLEQSEYDLKIVAIGPSSLRSENPLALSFNTLARPTLVWDDEVSLTVLEQDDYSVLLSWPTWNGAQPITQYELYQDHALVQTLLPNQTQVLISELNPKQSYLWQVQVRDSDDGFSHNGPSLQLEQPDTHPPTWPNAELNLDALTSEQAQLSWSTAQDLDQVRSYIILLNGIEYTQVSGDLPNVQATEQLNYTLNGLSPNQSYQIQIQAEDLSFNRSTDGPSLSFTTPEAIQTLSDLEVMQGLAPACALCHGGCPNCLNDWFSSLDLFRTHIVSNSELIVPGQGENSELILLLKGESAGLWGQMPPSYIGDGASFLERQQRGETLITIQEISHWINQMDQGQMENQP